MYITLDKLVFNVTKACPGHCLHCQLSPSQKESAPGAIDAGRAAQALLELNARHKVGSVLLFGGEPMLFPERVYTLARAARAAGIPGRAIISNGFVEGKRDPENARRAAFALADAGIVTALVSVDAFHEVHIPFEPVYAFVKGLVQAGVNVQLHPAWVTSSQADNPYNARTRAALGRFSSLGAAVSEGNVIFPSGSAARHLSTYFDQPELETLRAFRCGDAPYTSPLDAVNEVHIDPNGDVLVCGFAIGNLVRRPLVDILEAYDPHSDPKMALLMRLGPYALYQQALEQGLSVDTEGIYSGCELCARACSALRAAAN